MAQSIVYVNGRMQPAEEARLSPFDYGLLYGLAVFETMRAYQGRPFRLAQHLARLRSGAEKLGIPLSIGDGELAEAIAATLRANGLGEARVRLTVTAGEGLAGPTGPPDTGPTTVISAFPLAATTEQAYEKGHAAIISTVRRSSLSVTPRIKSTNLLENMLARREAEGKGAEQAIMLNEKRCIAECASANIFFVAYGRLLTPSLDCGLLAGVTREAVIEIAVRRALPVDERWIQAEEVWDAEELFVTSSPLGIFPVTSVNGRPIHGGRPGKVTRALTMAYQDLVREELSLGGA